MEHFIENYGIFALAFCLLIDDMGVPFPTTTVIFSSAVLARTIPEISVFSLLFLAIFIPPVGNYILFYWGKHGARTWLNTHGHKFFLPNKRLKKADRFFKKYGEKTIFVGAMITSLRPVLSIIAGSSKMNPAKFAFYHFMGVIIWASVVIGTGYFWGEEIVWIMKNNFKIVIVIILLIIGSRFVHLSHTHIRNHHKERNND